MDLSEMRGSVITDLTSSISDFEFKINELNLKIENSKNQKLTEQQSAKRESKWERIEINHAAIESGFIYILSNSLLHNTYKIGFTARNPDERAKEISAHYKLPSAFKVEYFKKTLNPYIVEQRVISQLLDSNVGGEFVRCEYEKIVNLIEANIILN